MCTVSFQPWQSPCMHNMWRVSGTYTARQPVDHDKANSRCSHSSNVAGGIDSQGACGTSSLEKVALVALNRGGIGEGSCEGRICGL